MPVLADAEEGGKELKDSKQRLQLLQHSATSQAEYQNGSLMPAARTTAESN